MWVVGQLVDPIAADVVRTAVAGVDDERVRPADERHGERRRRARRSGRRAVVLAHALVAARDRLLELAAQVGFRVEVELRGPRDRVQDALHHLVDREPTRLTRAGLTADAVGDEQDVGLAGAEASAVVELARAGVLDARRALDLGDQVLVGVLIARFALPARTVGVDVDRVGMSWLEIGMFLRHGGGDIRDSRATSSKAIKDSGLRCPRSAFGRRGSGRRAADRPDESRPGADFRGGIGASRLVLAPGSAILRAHDAQQGLGKPDRVVPPRAAVTVVPAARNASSRGHLAPG